MEDTALIDIPLENVPADIAGQVRAILLHMMEGATLTAACRKIKLPMLAFYRWADSYPEVRNAFTQATEIWSHVAADELMTMPDTGFNPQVMRIHSDNIKWLTSRRNRRDYGDSTQGDDAVQGALVDALHQAIQRIPRPIADPIKIIDAQAIETSGE